MSRLLIPTLLAALTLSLPAAATEAPCQGDSFEVCDDELATLGARFDALDPGHAYGDEAALSAAAVDVVQAFSDAGQLGVALDLAVAYVDAVEAGVDPQDAGLTLLQSHPALEAVAPLLYHPGMDPGTPMADQPVEELRVRIDWEKVKWWVGEFFHGVWDMIVLGLELYQEWGP